jgi:hemerythrin-like domain-containing protein
MKRWQQGAAVLAVLATTLVLPAAGDDRPTAGFRADHAEIAEHLRHLDAAVGALPDVPASEQRQKMAFVVRFLEEHIKSHAAWEESHLYPLVEQQAGREGEPFTASMRYEHRIIGRGIEGLAALAAAEPADARAFARAADRTLAVITAHFEKEEQVFLPLLDRAMTRAEVDAALGAVAPH